MDKKLTIKTTDFSDLFIIEPDPFYDERGFFSRVFCKEEIKEFMNLDIKQINHSYSKNKGTIRGLHFQHEPYSEAKIIKCIKGGIHDIVVDIRRNSPTFLKHFSIRLDEENQKMLLIPKGFAHGFQTLQKDTELLYLHSNIFSPNQEDALNVMDPLLNIKWPLGITSISNKDKHNKFIDNNFKGMIIK